MTAHTDRELLELAAKAICLPHEGFTTGRSEEPDGGLYTGLLSKYWNPLTDDGDALRLAVQLGFRIDFDDCGLTWVEEYETCEAHKDDRYAATRRAIVRAAAEIGRAML